MDGCPTGELFDLRGASITLFDPSGNRHLLCAFPYSVQMQQSSACQITETFSITPDPVCVNDDITISMSGSVGNGASYLWNFGPDASQLTSSDREPNGISFSSGGTKSISCTIDYGTAGSCSTTTLTGTVEVIEFTSITGSTIGMCEGESQEICVPQDPNVIYNWSSSPPLTINTSNITGNECATMVNVTTLTTVTLERVSALNSNCSDITTWTLDPTPAKELVILGPTDVCSESLQSYQVHEVTATGTTLVATGPTTSFLWTVSPNPLVGIVPGNVASLSNATANTVDVNFGTTTTFVNPALNIQVTEDGCLSATGSQINLFPVSGVDITVNSTPQCVSNQDFDLSVSPSTNTSYSWTVPAGGTPTGGSGPTLNNLTFPVVGSYDVTVTAVKNNFSVSCTDQDVQTIEVIPDPIASFTHDPVACENESVDFTFTGTASTHATFAWDFGNGVTSTLRNPTGIVYATNGNYTISLTVTDGNCSASANAQITINPSPTVTAGPDQTICNGSSATLTATATPATASLTWSPGGATGSPYTVTSTGTYTVTAELNGCTAQDQVNVQVGTGDPLDLGPDVTLFCGDQITLNAPANWSTYTWSPTDPSPANNDFEITVCSTGTYSLTVTDAGGCTDSDDITITMDPGPAVTLTKVLDPAMGYPGLPMDVKITLTNNSTQDRTVDLVDGGFTATSSISCPGTPITYSAGYQPTRNGVLVPAGGVVEFDYTIQITANACTQMIEFCSVTDMSFPDPSQSCCGSQSVSTCFTVLNGCPFVFGEHNVPGPSTLIPGDFDNPFPIAVWALQPWTTLYDSMEVTYWYDAAVMQPATGPITRFETRITSAHGGAITPVISTGTGPGTLQSITLKFGTSSHSNLRQHL